MLIAKYAELYRTELLDQIIPFWENNSVDWQYGGYYSCLDSDGHIYDTDKFVWLQCRQLYTFSRLFLDIEPQKKWLEIARNGAKFLEKYGRNGAGNWYFSLNHQGQPLVQPYNIFSDCFAALGFYTFGKAAQDPHYLQIGLDTFNRIIQRKDNPKGVYNKAYPDTRPQKGFALPMILCNLCLELADSLHPELVESTIDNCITEIFTEFYDSEHGVIREYVLSNGSFFDHFDGRLVNPGHGIEAMWFIMDIATLRNDDSLFNHAAEIMLDLITYGWDKKFGGIYYFMDVSGHPPQQLEWDQKLWWVHLETLIGLAKAFQKTRQSRFADKFVMIHDYSWNHFRDLDKQGEWFGYLNRQGEIQLPLKGGKWKGCFHVPRALFKVWKALEDISKD